VKKLLIEESPRTVSEAQRPDALAVWNEPNLKIFGRNPRAPANGMPWDLYSERLFEPTLKAVRSLPDPIGDMPVIGPSASAEGPDMLPWIGRFVDRAVDNLEAWDRSHGGKDIAHDWNLSIHMYPTFQIMAGPLFEADAVHLLEHQDSQLINYFLSARRMAQDNDLGDEKVWVDEWGINAKRRSEVVGYATVPPLGQDEAARQLTGTFCKLAPLAGPMIRYTSTEDWPGTRPQTEVTKTTNWGYGAFGWEAKDPNNLGTGVVETEYPSYSTLRKAAVAPAQYCPAYLNP